MLETIKKILIELLIKHKIINFNFEQPIMFKSGIRSPIYCDFRKCLGYPEIMQLIEDGFMEIITDKNTGVIAAVATGAVAYGDRLAKVLNKPLAYVRPGAKAKDHGLGKLIEGAEVSGKKVILIEDLVSTASSLIDNAKVLLAAGAKEVKAYSIFTYGMQRSVDELAEAKLKLTSILAIDDLRDYFSEYLNDDEFQSISAWIIDPENWFPAFKDSFEFGYLTKLRQSNTINKSIICLGIDPVIEMMPEKFARNGIQGMLNYFEELFNKLDDINLYPASFKLNRGFFTRHDMPEGRKFIGSFALHDMIKMIRDIFPESNIILDAKFGDIGKSSENYAVEAFDVWGADAVTISGYMGSDSIEPFIKRCNVIDKKGVYILARTSNPGAKDLQNSKTSDGRFVYEVMGDLILNWAKSHPGVGAVVGATSVPELRILMEKFSGKDISLLIPGVGGQGGSANDVMIAIRETDFEKALIRINSSSGLCYPWGKKPAPADWLDQCVKALEELECATA